MSLVTEFSTKRWAAAIGDSTDHRKNEGCGNVSSSRRIFPFRHLPERRMRSWDGTASEVDDMRREMDMLIQAEHESRVAETTGILHVMEALREELACTNAALENMSDPETLYCILRKSRSMNAHVLELKRHHEEME